MSVQVESHRSFEIALIAFVELDALGQNTVQKILMMQERFPIDGLERFIFVALIAIEDALALVMGGPLVRRHFRLGRESLAASLAYVLERLGRVAMLLLNVSLYAGGHQFLIADGTRNTRTGRQMLFFFVLLQASLRPLY